MLFNPAQSPQQLAETVAGALEEASLYYGHGTDNAWDEACWLVESVLQKNAEAGSDGQPVLTQSLLDELQLLLDRRIQERVPLAYLLQEAWFAGLPFYVDERVLVPRSPLAEPILSGFATLLQKPPQRILDLCTGSGCIGIAAALQFPEARVVLSDLSAEALEVAKINIRKYQLEDRVEAIQSDLFDQLHDRFDLILCNPPYVGQAEYASLPDEYLHEPAQALLTEDEGLAIPLAILRQAADYLSPDGCLVLEVGNSWEALEQALPDFPFLWLEFDHGGHGVCALTASLLRKFIGLKG